MLNLKKHIILILALSLTLAVSAPAGAASKKAFKNMYADVSAALLANSMKSGSNIMISPISVLTAVSMLENGSSGRTRAEMEAVLGGIPAKKASSELSKMLKKLSSSDTVVFRTPCSIWYRKNAISIKKSYIQSMKKYFSSAVYPSDFSSKTVNKINNWVSRQTEGKIDSIINDLDPLTRVILVNATYFKGDWADQYSGTVKRKFTKQDGSKKTVPMMEGTENDYFEVNGAKGFVKHYSGGNVSFVAILPKKGTSLKSFLKKTSGSAIRKAYVNRKTRGVIVKTRIPKFKYSFETSLKDSLRKFGIRSAFSNTANFKNMTKEGVHVDDILHKTYISLDENGTEAAAVTAAIVSLNSAFDPTTPEVKTVYLNRPFLYEIVDTASGLPLFIGAVYDP